MNKDTFHTYLVKPEELDSGSLGEITDLVNEYPYFQAAQLLLVKNLQNEENIRFNKQLKLTAAYISNRSLLFELLNKEVAKTDHNKEKAPDPPPKTLNLVDTDISQLTNLTQDSGSPFFLVPPEELKKPEEGEPDAVTPPAVTPPDVTPPVKEKEAKKPVEEPIKEPVIDSDAPVSEASKEDQELLILDDESVHQMKKSADNEELKKSKYLKELERFVPIADIDLLMFDFPQGKNTALLEFEFEGKSKTEDSEAIADHMDDESENYFTSRDVILQFIQSDPLLKRARPTRPYRKSSANREPAVPQNVFPLEDESEDKGDLISTFIRKRPTMSPLQDDPQADREDISLSSLEEDDDIMTETLAEIYVKQKYHYKAIHVYEKLSLKYPEKSIYFASQIEKIREVIKNQ